MSQFYVLYLAKSVLCFYLREVQTIIDTLQMIFMLFKCEIVFTCEILYHWGLVF